MTPFTYRPTPIHRRQPAPSLEPRRLPQSTVPHTFNVLIDYTDCFSTFYAALATYAGEEGIENSFEERAASLDCDDLVRMATQSLGDMICRGTQQLGNGVSYSDVAHLTKHAIVRETLWPDGPNLMPYRPVPTPTEQYHLDLMEDSVSSVISEMFHGCLRRGHEAPCDAILWRTTVAMMIETAQAIETAGRQLHIGEHSLMCYEIDQAFPAKDRQGRVGDAYIYVIAMRGP